MKILLAFVVCILTSLSAAAQSLSLFDIDTTNFPAMKAKFHAFDAAGNPVRPNIGDVSITENGTPRTVTNITCPPPVKSTLSVCIMVDTKYHVGLARAGAERLVNFLDMPQDELGITMMDKGVQIHRDFTHDRTKALAAASTIPGAPGVDVQAMFYAPITGGVPFITGRKADKKVLILVSDLHCPKLNLDEQQLYADAAKENISVYSILLHADDYTGLFKRVAANTGGKVFEKVSTETEITNIFQEIERREHYAPCEITWQSGLACLAGTVTAELAWSGQTAKSFYTSPAGAVAQLSFSPYGIFCKSKPVGVPFDTTVTVAASNGTFTVSDIVSSNPLFDINPKQFTLNAGQSRTLTVRYTPADSSYVWTKFDIQNNLCPQTLFAAGGFPGKKPIKPTLKLTYPNGGETFVVGSDTVITWEGIPATDTVALEFSNDNGATWRTLTTVATRLQYAWSNIPKPASTQCLVRVAHGGLPGVDPKNPAPPIEWQKTLGGSGEDYASSIQPTPDGGYVVAGNTGSNNGDVTGSHGDMDFWVVKLDRGGNRVWQKTLGGNWGDKANSIQPTLDGGYVVAGYAHSNGGDITESHGIDDFWVVKLDAGGNIVWQKTLGGTSDEKAYSIELTSDGGYVVAGYTNSHDGDVTGNHGDDDFWVVKLDVDGNIVWQKTLGGSGQDEAYSIQPTPDGGYVVAGYAMSNDGDVTGNHGEIDLWVVKLDAGGNMVWQKTLGGSSQDNAYSIQATLDGGYVTAGWTASNDGDVTGNHGDMDLWVVKLDAGGNMVWQKTLGGGNWDEAHSIKQTLDGGYAVAGFATSSDGDVIGSNGISGDFWVVKLDAGGNIVWQKTLGGIQFDGAYSMQATLDGGYVAAGGTRSNNGDVIGNQGLGDFWVVKLAPDRGNTLQSDTSDAVFSIIAPEPVVQVIDVDMGKVVVGDYKDNNEPAVICNRGAAPLHVLGLDVTSSDTQDFMISRGAGDFFLGPGKCQDITFTFTPTKVGKRSAKATLRTTVGNFTDTITIHGEGIAPLLQVETPMVNFGKVLIGTTKDTLVTVTIRNVGSAALAITGTRHDKPNDKDFSTLAGGGGFTLQPGATQAMQLRFVPSDEGRTSGLLSFEYSGPGSPAQLQLIGEGVTTLPGKVETASASIDFGKVLIGSSKDSLRTITVRNSGIQDIDITNVRPGGANAADFSILNGGGAFTLKGGDTARLDLRFTPSAIGSRSAVLLFEFNGTGSPIGVPLIGEGVRPTDSITLVAGTATAFPGEHTTIPITLELPQNSTLSNVTGFDVTLRYNSTLLFPVDNSMTITSSGNDALLTFFAPYNPAGGELLRVPFIATLGDDTTTIVKIEKAMPRISSGNVDIATRDGSFALKGVCYAGGAARLYKPSGRAMLMAIHPNPAEDEAEIEYETSETGVTSLKIVNALGMEVAVPASAEMEAGFHVAKVFTSEFGAGTYFVVMTTPTERHVARFEVVR